MSIGAFDITLVVASVRRSSTLRDGRIELETPMGSAMVKAHQIPRGSAGDRAWHRSVEWHGLARVRRTDGRIGPTLDGLGAAAGGATAMIAPRKNCLFLGLEGKKVLRRGKIRLHC